MMTSYYRSRIWMQAAAQGAPNLTGALPPQIPWSRRRALISERIFAGKRYHNRFPDEAKSSSERWFLHLTFAGRGYFTEHGRRSGVIIYPNRLCNISGHRSARSTNEESISIISRSMNRSLVVAIACKYNFSRWRPKWRQNRYLYVSGHRLATKTNKDSISIILRSTILAIAFKCNYPRWRPQWPPKHTFVCRSS